MLASESTRHGPPAERSAGAAIDDFRPVALALRQRLTAWYAARGEEITGPAAEATRDTNSTLAERRAEPLLRLLYSASGRRSLVGLRVLDSGCGFGSLSVLFASRGAEVTGIDANGERLEVGRGVAAEHGLPATFRRAAMARVPIDDEQFDVVVHNNSLCYVVRRRDRQEVLLESLRLLVPGGWLVVRNPNRWSPLDPFTGLPGLHLLPPRAAVRAASLLGRRRSYVRLRSPGRARRELARAGFREIHEAATVNAPVPRISWRFARYHHVAGRRPVAVPGRGSKG